MLVGVNKFSGKVTQIYAMDGGPGATPETNDINGNGGAAGIWQGGMGISTDGRDRIFLVTGKNLHLFFWIITFYMLELAGCHLGQRNYHSDSAELNYMPDFFEHLSWLPGEA
jgi:hypothetical protein